MTNQRGTVGWLTWEEKVMLPERLCLSGLEEGEDERDSGTGSITAGGSVGKEGSGGELFRFYDSVTCCVLPGSGWILASPKRAGFLQG